MFGTLGMQEILLLMAMALLIFGPKKLPEIGRTLGRAMGEFRRATTDFKRTLEYEADLEESRAPAKPSPAQLPASTEPAASTAETADESSADDAVAAAGSDRAAS